MFRILLVKGGSLGEQTLLGININRQLLHLDLLKVVGTKIKKNPRWCLKMVLNTMVVKNHLKQTRVKGSFESFSGLTKGYFYGNLSPSVVTPWKFYMDATTEGF